MSAIPDGIFGNSAVLRYQAGFDLFVHPGTDRLAATKGRQATTTGGARAPLTGSQCAPIRSVR